MVFRNILALITAMFFIAGCDQYSSWGPMCVNPVDNFKAAKTVEVRASDSNWLNTGITVADGDRLDIELVTGNESIPVTLCGRQVYRNELREKIVMTVDATQENWSLSPADIPELQSGDLLLLNFNTPNAANGPDGNKWSAWNQYTSCDYPGSGGLTIYCCNGCADSNLTLPNYTVVGAGSTPWNNELGVFDIANNACTSQDSHSRNGKKCWDVYGSASYRLVPGGNASPLASATETGALRPDLVKSPPSGFDITKADESALGRVTLSITGSGRFQARVNDCAGCYHNNLGGYKIDIARYGCARRDGQGLVYQINSATPNSSASGNNFGFSCNGATNPDGSCAGKTTAAMVPSSSGTLWLKINDPDGDYSAASNEGSYLVNIVKRGGSCPPGAACDPKAPNNIMSSAIGWIVSQIEDVLRQAQKDLFEGLAGTSENHVGSLVNFIRACLVLYIALYGAAFTFGLIQSPQMDFIIRVMKIAIVIQLIGPNAWNFFNTYFFTLFTDGTKYIIYIMNNLFDTGGTIYGSGQEWLRGINDQWANNGDATTFLFLDRTVGQFLEQSFWIRLIGLLFTGPFGWLYIIAIIIGMVIFTIGVIQAILAYIIALIAMAMLIGIAPLFITFLLFTQTKDLFEAWIQQLVNYALRPIFMFTTLAIFNFLMWAALIRMMSYGVCWKCILNIKFDTDFLPTLCVIYFYQPMGYDNFGDQPNTLMPISFFSILTYLILAVLMQKFVPFMEQLASSITGSTAKAQILAPAGALANDLKRPFGMDKDSKARRVKAASDNKKVAAMKRGMIKDRELAKQREDFEHGGKGMKDFDTSKKLEQQKELEKLRDDTKKDGKTGESKSLSIKERAKMLEDRMKGASDADIEAGGMKGMAKFDAQQREERQKEMDDMIQARRDHIAGGKGMEGFDKMQKDARQKELDDLRQVKQLDEEAGGKGMAKFEQQQREERQKELGDVSNVVQERQMDQFLESQREARKQELSDLSDTMQNKQSEPKGMDEFLDKQRQERQEEMRNLEKPHIPTPPPLPPGGKKGPKTD